LEVGEASVVAQLEPVRSSPRSHRLRREQHQRHRLERLSGAASKWYALGCKLPNGEGSAWPGNPGLREKLGLLICTTPAYSPESNGMAESFVKTFKRDYVYLNELHSAASVMGHLAAWFEDYNEVHPHKGLRLQSPREYRRATST